jgi:hypothetical protein
MPNPALVIVKWAAAIASTSKSGAHSPAKLMVRAIKG